MSELGTERGEVAGRFSERTLDALGEKGLFTMIIRGSVYGERPPEEVGKELVAYYDTVRSTGRYVVAEHVMSEADARVGNYEQGLALHQNQYLYSVSAPINLESAID